MLFDGLVLLSVLGAILLTILVVQVILWTWKYFVWPLGDQGPRLAERYGKGSWALVTGASDGLGRAFSTDLAKAGFNVVLVSRTQEKLSRLQSELEALGVQVKTVCADLSDTSESTYSRIASAAEPLDLAMVVNCVGTTIHRRYDEVSPSIVRRLVSVNVTTTALVTNTLLPLLLRHSQSTGHRASVLNVGSIVGRFYWPGTQLYGACKAFIDHLTIPLAYEYKGRIDVLSFQPTVMATSMAAGTEPAAITIAPQQASHAALAHLGRSVQSHGHWRHALASVLFQVLPRAIRNRNFLTKALEMGAVERSKGE